MRRLSIVSRDFTVSDRFICRLALLIVLSSIFYQPAYSAGPTFVCDGTPYPTFGSNPTTLQEIDKQTLVISNIAAVSPSGTINATGYNILDDYIYGLKGKDFYQLAADGTYIMLGKPVGVGAASGVTWNIGVTYAGTMDTSGNWYGHDTNYVYRVSIGVNPSAGSLTYERFPRSGSFMGKVADLAFNPLDGNLYGMSASNLRKITVAGVGSTVTTSGSLSGSAGGAWSTSSGTLYFYNNGGGLLYSVDMTQSPPVASFVGNVAKNGTFDATACTPPVLAKSVSDQTVGAGEAFTYTFKLSNPFTNPLVVEFTDNLPTGFSFVGGSLSPSAPGGGTVATFNANTLVISNLSIPAGLPPANEVVFTAQAVADPNLTSTLTIPNQAQITYGNSTTISDDPGTGPIDDPTSVTVYAHDWGDAPSSYGHPKHLLPNTSYSIGTAPDGDIQTQNTANGGSDGTGDDSNGVADENGVFIPTLIQGETARIDIDVTQAAANGAYLQAWIDWNGDGDFADVGEQIASDQQYAGGVTGIIELPITIPTAATTSQTFARFRWSTLSGLSSVATAGDGEVEDYAITILPDTPPLPPGSGLGSSVCSATTPASAYDNRSVAWEHNSPTNTTAPSIFDSAMVATAQNYAVNGLNTLIDETFVHVDVASMTSSYDANRYFEYQFKTTALTSGVTEVVGVGAGLYETTLPSHSSKSGHYRFAVLIDDDPLFASPEVLINNAEIKDANTSYADITWGPYDIGHSIFHYAHYNVNGTAVQLAPNTDYKVRVYPYAVSASGSSSSGVATYPNLVLWDDFSIKMVNCAIDDFGDAPDSYGTTDASGGAKHSIDSNIYLGANKPDPESDGVPSATADSDDINMGSDDEDGVATLPPLSELDSDYRISVNVTNTTAMSARLIAWIDFDGNGTFDSNEAAARVVPPGTTANNITVTWSSIPPDIQQGNHFLRLRLTTDSMNANEAKGAKLDGEVEDYAIMIGSSGATVSGRVYIDANSNASEDAGEAGIGSTVVILLDVSTGTCLSTTTNGNGDYSFAGVSDGTYKVYQAQGETTPTPQDCGVSFVNNPTGFQSTTPDTLMINVSGVDVSDQDFGEVAGTNSTTSGNTGGGILFEPDHQSEVLPGNVVFYTHVFSTEADGNVSFSTIESGNIANGWAHTLYLDSDCNGALDGNESDTTINGISLGMTGGARLCLIDKVYSPANVPAQDQYEVKTTATFIYAGGILAPVTLEVTDLTIASQSVSPTAPATPEVGESGLVLRKTVENLTQATLETSTLNQASPGDVLKYRIYYRNTGTGSITDLEVNDTVPAFTGFVLSSESCDVTPVGMACIPTITIDALNWEFTGSLGGGVGGNVSYEVLVDN